ncbi:putative acetylxylan esterase A [Rhypophila decipiens]|uniref:Carboxylic ester hydrolase n=1 Tax=Rhypophila decipiens TaxID=261697 RepID=A0AAN7B4H1_9PEZI|nr:putative acetylxylan esterase A [Rhypophila decipiens]
MKFATLTSALLGMASIAIATPTNLIKRATLSQVNNFGANPSGAKMYIYVPDKLSSNPAVVVAIHYCTGTAQAYYSGTPYASLAESHGFIVIYPESPYSGGCWDVSSPASLTRDGGGNSNAIANMVKYVLSQYKADASRVFVTGTSSGAMMTNVMAATYPDLFKAASVYNGVPAGCFSTGTVNGWNSDCAQGRVIRTSDAWADIVHDMYGVDACYTGSRPRMLIMHGGRDDILYPQNFNETMKQWAGVHDYVYGAPVQTLQNNPQSGYVRYVYGPYLEGIYNPQVGHSVPVMGDVDMAWFGLSKQSPAPITTTSTTAGPTTTSTTSVTRSTSTTSTSTTAAPTPTGCTAARWGQCGGIGFNGCKTCASPWTCKYQNDWYSQCL